MIAKGGVIYIREAAGPAAPHEIGVFFSPLGDRAQEQIILEVERLLSE